MNPMDKNIEGNTCVDISIAIMREFEPPEGYYLAFSGGKDSVCLYRLAELAGVKFDAHYSVTTIDPPELTRFIKREYPTVHWEMPEKSFFEWMETKGVPSRLSRWCCERLKENGGRGRRVLVGVRADESSSRSKYGIIRKRYTGKKELVSPMLAWTDADVWQFIREEGLPYCSLYDEGFSRLGCIICPLQSPKCKRRSMERWPRYWTKFRAVMATYWHKSEAAQRHSDSPEAFFAWWLSGTGRESDDQLRLEFEPDA